MLNVQHPEEALVGRQQSSFTLFAGLLRRSEAPPSGQGRPAHPPKRSVSEWSDAQDAAILGTGSSAEHNKSAPAGKRKKFRLEWLERQFPWHPHTPEACGRNGELCSAGTGS